MKPSSGGVVMTSTRPAELRQAGVVGVAAAVGVGCAAVTIYWCTSMAAMSSMGSESMGGEMNGEPRSDLLGFIGTWTVMMLAMMMPALVPMLQRYRLTTMRPQGIERRTVVVGLAYFAVWVAAGVAVFVLGAVFDLAQQRIPAIAGHDQLIAGIVVLAAGVVQFTGWKARQLECCRSMPADRSAWRHGLRIGLHCCCVSAGLMAILLVLGLMNLAVMALVTAAIASERLAPAGRRVACGIGVVAVAAGAVLTIASL
jgi:predicted metal-binding membrane protein